MSTRKQRDFFDSTPDFKANRHTHGGSAAQGKRKLMRPFDRRRPVHVTMRSSKAKGALSMLRADRKLKIEALVRKTAAKHGVTIHQYANVGNHLHLVAKAATKRGFQNFLRLVGGLTARLVTGARKGKAFGKFWDALAFSRVITGQKALKYAEDYVYANLLEGKYAWWVREEFLHDRKINRRRDQSKNRVDTRPSQV